MSYIVEEDHRTDRWRNPMRFSVRRDKFYVPVDHVTEAEANIIAFALNAVAEGKHLVACGCDDPDATIPGKTTTYDGPTEGVAPNADPA